MPMFASPLSRKLCAAALTTCLLLTDVGPALAVLQTRPVGVGVAIPGALYPAVNPELLQAFQGFAADRPALSGLDIAPIVAPLLTSRFQHKLGRLGAMRSLGNRVAATEFGAELEKEILAMRDAAAPEVKRKLLAAVAALDTPHPTYGRDYNVFALEHASRGLAGYFLKDEEAQLSLAEVSRSAYSLRGQKALRATANMIEGGPRMGRLVNDVTRLNPIKVQRVETPRTIEEISTLVKDHPGPVSVGGGRYSQGGQTATEGAMQLDLRRYHGVIEFRPEERLITVKTGTTWREIQTFIDKHDLSVKIMQSYSNFTVGGALSVNAHGRYAGLGPVIGSVRAIKVVLADGSIVTASPTSNPELFYGAIGGYGALGVIAEATLELVPNEKLERRVETMPLEDYPNHFDHKVRDAKGLVMLNGDIHPPYKEIRSVTWSSTDKPVTVKERLIPENRSYRFNQVMMRLITERPWGALYRRFMNYLDDARRTVAWRNHEASYDVRSLEPASRAAATYVLQEYFVPVSEFSRFAPRMIEVLKRYGVNVVNVSLRHANADHGSLMSWARQETFAFVLYYKQGVGPADRGEVAVWTRELIDAVLACGGAYYLPYQIHATLSQFLRAYPKAPLLFALKAALDPTYKFRNKLWDAYYDATPAPPAVEASRFKTVFGSTESRDGFFRFLQNIYRLYPEAAFHRLIAEATREGENDEAIYRKIQERLPSIKPFLGQLRYALPSLVQQKAEISDETAKLLGDGAKINGYVEIGTVGRYVNSLKRRLDMRGPVYVLPLNETGPGFSVPDIMERGQLSRVGTYVPNRYDPIAPEQIPDASVDLVTIYIGLHHTPSKKLDAFVRSLWRILRPGGKLVLRDHDADSPAMQAMAGLAHDVYNAGLGLSWEENAKEIRHFNSSADQRGYLKARGFKDSGKRIFQANDPTENALMEFVKVAPPNDLPQNKRAEETSFLSLPEWYIVYSAEDYALSLYPRSGYHFAYFRAIAQYWSHYLAATRMSRGHPFNLGSHFMLWVIGASFTAENLVKGVYENTVGRLTELLVSDQYGIRRQVAEDLYAENVALDYARFLKATPWYEYPFGAKLKGLWGGLWSETWFEPPSRARKAACYARKIERRAFLTAEYAFKAVYAKLMRLGTQATWAPEAQTTVVAMDDIPEDVLRREPDLKVLGRIDEKTVAVALPRYAAFTGAVQRLAAEGLSFREIAGNKTILVTLSVDRHWKGTLPVGTPGFEAEMTDNPMRMRVAVVIPVARLHELLRTLPTGDMSVEHVYDY